MLCLTIETSTPSGMVLLSEGSQPIAYKTFDASLNLSKELLPSIETILEENQLSPKQLRMIACGFGPGSYTGSRLAATVAKSLSFALDLPLISFCSAIAFLPNSSGRFIYVSDAKMGQLCLLRGIIDQGIAHYEANSLTLISIDNLEEHFKEIDFIVSSISFPSKFPTYLPQLNPPLLTTTLHKKFINNEFSMNHEIPLIYYR